MNCLNELVILGLNGFVIERVCMNFTNEVIK